jgi:hypothetical protein
MIDPNDWMDDGTDKLLDRIFAIGVLIFLVVGVLAAVLLTH